MPVSVARNSFSGKAGVTMKRMWKAVFGCIALCILFLAVSWVHHLVRIADELQVVSRSKLSQLVRVDDHTLNVYTEGEGNKTLVFMAGSGTSAPTLDFKPLWINLVEDYGIVVVEKAGYGFSEVVKGIPRDVDSILADTRQALKKAGQAPPYVLVPHSMSALEAIHWANTYPEEI